MNRFGDSIDANTQMLQDIMSDMPPHARSRARDAGKALTRVINTLAKDNRGCAGTALGVAYALHYHTKRMCESMQASADKTALNSALIELPH